MAYDNNYVDIDFILDKLYQDYGFDDIEYNDVAEDIWDCIGLVADPGTFETKFADVVIADYKGTLPTDFYSITEGAIIEKSSNIPLVTSLDLMDRFTSDTTIMAETDAVQYTYRIVKGYIYTGLEDALLTMSYKAFPMEDRSPLPSLPLVPNHAKAIRMVVDYIAEKLAFKLFLKERLAERAYDKILQKSCWATSSWRTASKIPNADTMERLKNIHLNILRNPNMHDNQFKNLGLRSRVYIAPVDENQDLNFTINFTLTATADSQTTFTRPSTISAANLSTVGSLGTWIATIGGTEYPMDYGSELGDDIYYDSDADEITYTDTDLGALTTGDTIVFTYNIQ